MVDVFVADGHEIVRQGVRRLFEATADISVVGEAADGRAVLEAFRDASWNVLILEVLLPRVSGLEVLRRVYAARPALPVVVLSMFPASHLAAWVLGEGAVAFVSKEEPLARLEAAVRAAANGDRRPPADPRPPAPARPHHALSAREHQVFLLVLHGRSSVEIAAELDIVASTVSNHLGEVKRKLAVSTIAGVVGYAHRVGLISSPEDLG